MADMEDPEINASKAGTSSLVRWGTVAAIGLLAVMAVLAGGPALFLESPTFDEIAHIGASTTYVHKFDVRFNAEHPPLAKVLSGISMAAGGVRADYGSPLWTQSGSVFAAFTGEWTFGDWVALRWNDPHKVVFWARLPMLVLTLLLGWCLYVFATRLGGPLAGVLCLAVYASTPTFLTFGPLVLTDIPITLFAVLTVWTFAWMWQAPTRSHVRLFTMCLTGAFLAKFSAVLVLFAILIAAFTTRWAPSLLPACPPNGLERKAWRRQRWVATAGAVLRAWLAAYVFELLLSWNQPTDLLARLGTSIPAMALRRLLVPFVNFGLGAFAILVPVRSPVFLMGHSFAHGTMLYFPTLFLLKSMPGFLALLGITGGLALWARGTNQDSGAASIIPSRYALHWRFWWVTAVVYSAVCVMGRLDVSIRHFSIPIAMSIVMLAPLTNLIAGWAVVIGGWLLRRVVSQACLPSRASQRLCFTTRGTCPMRTSLAGGDRLMSFLATPTQTSTRDCLPLRTSHASIIFSAFLWTFSALPNLSQSCPGPCFGIARDLPDQDAGAWVVVSSNMIRDAENCGWLLDYPRQAVAGGSMYAFHLPTPIPPAGAVGGPPIPEAQKALFAFGAKDQPGFREMMVQIDRRPSELDEVVRKQMEAYKLQSQQHK